MVMGLYKYVAMPLGLLGMLMISTNAIWMLSSLIIYCILQLLLNYFEAHTIKIDASQ
jgi:hypothetical protein